MPPLPGHILRAGLYCFNCKTQKPASELSKLWVKWKPSDREPAPVFKLKDGSYCPNCLPDVEKRLKEKGAVEFKIEPFRPAISIETQR